MTNRTVVRSINKAIDASTLGGNGRNVYAMDVLGRWIRITRAKSLKIGSIYGLSLNTGQWFILERWETR